MKKIYNYVKKFILIRVFNTQIVIDRKPFLRAMLGYFTYKEWGSEHSITNVECFETRDNYIIRITTHRPGLLIGKAGILIGGLEDWLNKYFEKPVKIDLKDCTLWLKLYT